MSDEKSWTKARDHPIHNLLGLPKGRKRLQICCPFPDHDDSSPSFSLFDDNGYKCYGCDRKGSGAVDFLMHMGYVNQEGGPSKEILEEFG